MEWGEEAFAKAEREDKPVLLDIGAVWCHWCHVMDRESYENAETAKIINEHFIAVKVDRDERPDVDTRYQAAVASISGQGGWPLTAFLTPQGKPYFGGTYFPPDDRHGRPGLRRVLLTMAEAFHNRRDEVDESAGSVMMAIEHNESFIGRSGNPGPELVAKLVTAVLKQFDARSGGFGSQPKFPHSGAIDLLLDASARVSIGAGSAVVGDEAKRAALVTLEKMAKGGIYDHLAGGFHRYSVDERWVVPHFEKMLYDNGQLLSMYAWASLATGDAVFARVASDTADWLIRDMRAPGGAFYSSLDADSEGHEGRFYVWSDAEVRSLLSAEEYAAFAPRFGLERNANFDGQWHLHACAPEAPGVASTIESARAKLLSARNMRVWPARDEKLLTSWNALAIKGLAIAARVLDRPDLTDAATAAVDFIRHNLWRDGRLLATHKGGHSRLCAYLDDYAFLADALLELLQTRWRSSDLELAAQLLDVLLEQFEHADGGFYFTAADHQELFHRSKTFSDDSLPSGNGVATSVLCRMGYLLGDLRYLSAAERSLEAASQVMTEHSLSHMSMLNALEDFLTSTQIVIIRGDAATADAWSRQLGALYAPTRMIFAIPADAAGLPQPIEAKRPGDATRGYVCTGMTCSAPLTDLETLARRLVSRTT